MKLNKLVALTLTGIMAASLAACGGGSKPAETTAAPAAAPAETKAEAAAPAAAPADGADYSALDDVELILADTSSNGAALQQFKERLPHRIFSASGQHTVFKNMEHAGIILRQRPECNRKHDVFGFIVHPEYLCAGPVMFKQHSPAAQFFAVPDFFNGKAGKTLVHFESHAFVSPCSREFSPCLNQYFYCSPLQFLVKMRQEFRGLRGIYILYCKDCISTVGRRNAP